MSAVSLQSDYRLFQQAHPLQQLTLSGKVWPYYDCGSGEVLLSLPGFFGVAGTDFLYLRALQTHCRMISITYPEQESTVAGLVNGLSGFLDALHINRVHLLGGSYSGNIAQVCLRRFPDRLYSVILAQTGPPSRRHVPLALTLTALCRLAPEALLRRLMRRINAHYLPQITPEQVFWRTYFDDLVGSFSHQALTNRFRVVLDYHRRYHFTTHDLTDWPGAILLIESAEDGMYSADDMAQMRRIYPRAEVCRLEGEHTASVYDPQAQIDAIRAFILDRAKGYNPLR